MQKKTVRNKHQLLGKQLQNSLMVVTAQKNAVGKKLAHRQNSSCKVFACLTPHNQNFYCEKQRVKDKSFCRFCNKPTCEKLAHRQNSSCTVFACVNTTQSKLLLRKTAGKRQKFLQRKHRVQQHKFRKTVQLQPSTCVQKV